MDSAVVSETSFAVSNSVLLSLLREYGVVKNYQDTFMSKLNIG